MIILLIGPPGCGKGTQAELLCNEKQFVQLSTGDMLRAEIAAESELGKEVEAIMATGKLVPDQLMVDMIAGQLDVHHNDTNIILDGFPRTKAQAIALDSMLASRGLKIDYAIEMRADVEELVKRIEKRAKDTGGARADDNETVLRNRVKVYEEQTAPILPHYSHKGVHKIVDGCQPVTDVATKINDILTS